MNLRKERLIPENLENGGNTYLGVEFRALFAILTGLLVGEGKRVARPKEGKGEFSLFSGNRFFNLGVGRGIIQTLV